MRRSAGAVPPGDQRDFATLCAVAANLENPETAYYIVVNGVISGRASLFLVLKCCETYRDDRGIPSWVDTVLHGIRRTLVVMPELYRS